MNLTIKFLDVGKSLHHLFFHGTIARKVHRLRQITDSDVGGFRHHAGGGMLLTGKYFEQSGFAGAVFANKSNFVFLVDHKTHAFKQHLAAEFYLQILN